MATSPGCRCGVRTIFLIVLIAALTGCQGLTRAGADQSPHGTLSASPASLSFGNVMVGESKSLSASLKAAGAHVNVSSVTSASTEFAISGVALPASLDVGQSLNFNVTFTPQMSGVTSATLHFVSDADDSPTIQSDDGTGTVAPQHSVDLSWKASQSAGVVGYNVYRKSTDKYSLINTSLEAGTTYIDNVVDAGATYYYAVTAVDGNGAESAQSNKVQVVIPTP